MHGNLYVAPLLKFLEIVSRGDRSERQALSLVDHSAEPLFSGAFDAVTTLAYGSSSALKAHAALTGIVRVLWSMAPVELFTQPAPNFKYLAEKSVDRHLNFGDHREQLVRDLAVVFKRIRKFYRYGREATSFNPGEVKQVNLLKCQGWRCALCLFPFEEDLDRYAAEEEGVVVNRFGAHPDEVVLSATYRRPELDHIIPHLIGGDDPENWQILCKSCNMGKSDTIGGLSRHFSQVSLRVGDLYSFTAGKRFSVLVEHDRVDFKELPDGEYLRIFRKNNNGLLNVENLIGRVC